MSGNEWYENKIFSRFWNTYNLSQEWIRFYRDVYAKQLVSQNVNAVDEETLDENEDGSITSNDDTDLLADANIEDIEISEEYLNFIRATRAHQKEREEQRKQKLNEEKKKKNEIYIDVTEAKTFTKLSTIPDEKFISNLKIKENEFIELYGEENKNEIKNLEAKIQLTFNKFCDQHQPKIWPIVCRL